MFISKHLAAIIALALQVTLSNAFTVANTVLILVADTYSGQVASSGLNGYGIPYQIVQVPMAGIALPTLNSSASQGNFGGIIIVGSVSYDYSTGWASALTTDQWTQLYDYQSSFSVRMVRLGEFPTTDFGTTTAISDAGCCDAGVEQLISITDTSHFPTARINANAGMSTEAIWHYPATITNSTLATQFAQFAPSGSFTTNTVAAVINNFGNRQQMVWFIDWATDWSPTSTFLQHAYIHWMTRGLFVGKRKCYLNTQVDDMQLETDIYLPNGTTFRLRPGDLAAHATWLPQLNARLPAGSAYFLEIGHNGNGNIEAATDISSTNCNPPYAVEYNSPPDTPLEFQKPLGTGTDLWPPEFVNYTWSLACCEKDSLLDWFTIAANRDAFAHVSHTFTHEALNNATYHDTTREIEFNQAWLSQVGIANGERFSASGLIPPDITGLHNGDAIRAFMDNGIINVVGDNTRPVLMNPNSPFWPLITTVADNGYAGLCIVPRWATTIYYNCDTPDCTLQEWIATSAGTGTFTDLLNNARAVNTNYLLGLQPDPFMFHQANLRQTDAPTQTIGSQTGQFSLIQCWVETIAQELARLTEWPIQSLKHDDIATLFKNRMALDACDPNLSYTYSADGQTITGVTVTANSNTCSVPVPVTFPSTATTSATGVTDDQVGGEPLIKWVTLSGSPVVFTLSSPVAV